jgi:hypothetical protein
MTTRTSTHELISRWLEPDPSQPDTANWRIKAHRLPVWRVLRQFALEKDLDRPDEYRELVLQLESSDPLISEIAGAYNVPAKAILAAVAYGHDHPDLIAARLRLAHSADAG